MSGPTKLYGLEAKRPDDVWEPLCHFGTVDPIECDRLDDIQREAEWASRTFHNVRITFRQGAVA